MRPAPPPPARMRTIGHLMPIRVLTVLMFVAFAVSMMAQEVNIPDPGLNAAIRAAPFADCRLGKSVTGRYIH
jgi:hypothetical protein